MTSQATNQSEYEDSVDRLYERKHGPFDYSGRFARLSVLYLNDYKSFIDGVFNYLKGLERLGIDRSRIPDADFKTSTFIWDAGEKLQLLSRDFYAYRSKRSTRQVALTVGWTTWSGNQSGDCRFLKKDAAGNVAHLSQQDFIDTLAPPAPPQFPPAPPPHLPPAPPPVATPWARLRFSLQADKLFFDKGGFGAGRDVRIQAVGVQWIVTTPVFKFALDSDVEANRLLEYQMRNLRGIVVPTVVRVPRVDASDPPAEAQFPAACTTDDGVERVIASADPLIVGRSPFGDWEIDLAKPLRGGSPQSRFTTSDHAGYPNIIGVILHLALSAEVDVKPS